MAGWLSRRKQPVSVGALQRLTDELQVSDSQRKAPFYQHLLEVLRRLLTRVPQSRGQRVSGTMSKMRRASPRRRRRRRYLTADVCGRIDRNQTRAQINHFMLSRSPNDPNEDQAACYARSLWLASCYSPPAATPTAFPPLRSARRDVRCRSITCLPTPRSNTAKW